jgi:hypothetical protein
MVAVWLARPHGRGLAGTPRYHGHVTTVISGTMRSGVTGVPVADQVMNVLLPVSPAGSPG